MPLTLRDKATLLDVILSQILAGNTVTDISAISVIRQLCEGVAATQADLDYDLYTLLQSFYISSAEGADLDVRAADYGLVRDAGQAATDTVSYTRMGTWVEDIPLPAPQAVQATLADGTTVLYRSLGDVVLMPSGRSVSGEGPATTVSGGINDHLIVNLDGDGPQTVILGTQPGGVQIAAAIETVVRALIPHTPEHLPAYTGFRCDYSVTTAGLYTLRSGTAGPLSSVVVTGTGVNDASIALKLGLAHGGAEAVGQDATLLLMRCDTIGTLGNVSAGQVNEMLTQVAGVLSVANPLAFSTGRDPASDDAYRQDLRSYLLSLGRGCPASVERAVAQAVSADGQRHVMSSQVAYGVNQLQVFVCDGRSLTVGAQPDVIQAVQDELDGLGQEVGGWIPGGNVAGVVAAPVITVDVTVRVLLGPTPDLVRAQRALTQAIYRFLYGAAVGQPLSYAALVTLIDSTVVEMLGVTFTLPAAFSVNPTSSIGGGIGQKVMPGAIVVTAVRA